jgi:hypothetical protein
VVNFKVKNYTSAAELLYNVTLTNGGFAEKNVLEFTNLFVFLLTMGGNFYIYINLFS